MASPCLVTIAGAAQVLPAYRPAADCVGAWLARTVDLASIEKTVHSRLRKKIDRFSQIALLAASQLERHFAEVDKRRVGVFVGNDLAGWSYVHDQLLQMIETRDPMTINPYVATAWFPAAAQGEITIAHGILGQSKTFSAGFLSGGLALEHAARMVAGNVLDVALAGGVEAPDAPAVLLGLAAGRRISSVHPAGEAAGLIAMCRPTRSGAATMSMSGVRRCAETALDDIAEQFAGVTTLRYQSPSVDPGNRAWREILDSVESILRGRFGSRIELGLASWNGVDVGSASFPLAVIEASRAAAMGIPALVLGSDFDGLYLAGAVLPATQGAH